MKREKYTFISIFKQKSYSIKVFVYDLAPDFV